MNDRSNINGVVFAQNAADRVGGQGEFLHQMRVALAGVSSATVLSRQCSSDHVRCVSIPFDSGLKKTLSDGIRAIPIMRGRTDILTLLSDLDFDSRVSKLLSTPRLFDGIAGQCSSTLVSLRGTQTRTVLTSLNTHVEYLTSALDQEHRALKVRERHFVHPQMRSRMLREIELADVIRVPSSFAKETFVDAGVPDDKVVVVPIGIDLDHFTTSNKGDDVFRVLAVSTLDPRKGVVYLLEAYESLDVENSELMLVGSSGSRWGRRTLQLFSQRLDSLRVVSIDVTTEPVARSYGMASVFVHAAIEDGFGLVIPQALACGVPVIATRTSGASECIVHGETGFIVNARCPDEIREYLRLLANDSNLRERMGVRASESMRRKGYLEVAGRIRRFYANVAGGRSM